MKYAKVVLLQNELIAADTADYYDYKGMLKCPECGQIVFLRKGHIRNNVNVSAAFVHHKSVDPVACELRVNGYSQKDVDAINAAAKNQRLKLLNKWFIQMFTDAIQQNQLEQKIDFFKTKESVWYKQVQKKVVICCNNYIFRQDILRHGQYERNRNKEFEIDWLNLLRKEYHENSKKIVEFYEYIKNEEIAFEIFCFCLTAEGKHFLKALIPIIVYSTLKFNADNLKEWAKKVFDEDYIKIHGYSFLTIQIANHLFFILRQFIFIKNPKYNCWLDLFKKAEEGYYMNWQLGESKKKKGFA